MKIRVTDTPLPGVVLIDIDPFQDDRGTFVEPWHAADFAAAGLDLIFVQEGHSRSRRGVLRGLHYQDKLAPMGKLIRCTAGCIFDVAVDLRVGWPTFGKWFGVELHPENGTQVYIPPGVAHGFQAIVDRTEVQYKQTGIYMPSAEGTIAWDDAHLSIRWPVLNPILSQRDSHGQTITEYRRRAA